MTQEQATRFAEKVAAALTSLRLDNRMFKANVCPVRPPYVFDGKPYVKICPEARYVPPNKFEARTEGLSVQIHKLTSMSREECEAIQKTCDEIYLRCKPPQDNSFRMQVTHGTTPNPPGHVPLVELRDPRGRSVKVTVEEALKMLGSDDLKKTVTDVDGKPHVWVTNNVCAYCNKGYGRNPPFPTVNGKPTGGVCKRCKNVRYCSKACQRAHWSIHKTQCTQSV
jgi:hypothetical protein